MDSINDLPKPPKKFNIKLLLIFLFLLGLAVAIPFGSRYLISYNTDIRSKAATPSLNSTSSRNILTTIDYGKAIQLNYPSGGNVTVPASSYLNIQTNFSIEAWIKPYSQSFIGSNPYMIVAKESANGQNAAYSLAMESGKIVFSIFMLRDPDPPVVVRVTGNTYLQVNQWHHILGIREGNTLRLFVNGLTDHDPTTFTGNGWEPNNRKLGIGCALMVEYPNSCFSQFFGEIDEVRYSNSLRFPIGGLPPSGPFTPDGYTLGLWHLDDNANDSSGNGNNGIIMGSLLFIQSTVPIITPSPSITLSPTPNRTPTPTRTPTPSPTPSAGQTYKVFVTSTTYNGNLGGLSGADSKCQTRAQAAGLTGTYKAWLSDSVTSAKNRIISGRYVLVDGTTVIANSKADLIDGSIQNKINKDEYGRINTATDSSVYTGTNSSGNTTAFYLCNNWTTVSSSGTFGIFTYTDYKWTNALYGPCSNYRYLYCFKTSL